MNTVRRIEGVKLSLDQRLAGVLVPVFSLRGKTDLGVGDTAALIEFIDWVSSHGFNLVKMLPINQTGADNSPYNAISSRALEPTTIHTAAQAMQDLRQEEVEETIKERLVGNLEPDRVNYSVIKPLKQHLLEHAFNRFELTELQQTTARAQEFSKFVKAQQEWIEDYALFSALMELNASSANWQSWEAPHRRPDQAREWVALLPPEQAVTLERRMNFFRYVQWIAFEQWRQVKAHATQRGVALMGDIPFGVSASSVDVWANPHLFKEGWYGGTPPDKFFKHDPFVQKWGQNWGIPLYDWEAMEKDHFAWWRARVRGVREFFDLFRIDHILGFYRIYSFPWAPERNSHFLDLSVDDARERASGELPRFHPHPDASPNQKRKNRQAGERYLRVLLKEAGRGRVVGEDLGEVPDYVRPSLQALGIGG